MPEECGDFVSLSPRLDPCNGDVRAERSGLTAETELVKKLLSLFKDEFDLTPALANSYPDDIHPLEVENGGKVNCARAALTSSSFDALTFPRNFRVR